MDRVVTARAATAAWALVLLACCGGARGQTLLTDGERLVETVNPFTWSWYELPLVTSDGAGEDVLHNVAVEVDAETLVDAGGGREWARFDVIILNGSLPANAQSGQPGPITVGNPTCWINEECVDKSV